MTPEQKEHKRLYDNLWRREDRKKHPEKYSYTQKEGRRHTKWIQGLKVTAPDKYKKYVTDSVKTYITKRIKEDSKGYYEGRRKIVKKQSDKCREIVLTYLGDKCVYCGFTDKRALVLDHIKSDGWHDRKLHKGNLCSYYSTRLDKLKDNIQLLCSNCNIIKAKENKEFGRRKHLCS